MEKETYEVSQEMQAEAERMVIALTLSGEVEMFNKFAEELAAKYADGTSDDARNKVKEYLRRKVLNTDIDTNYGGGIKIGDASEV